VSRLPSRLRLLIPATAVLTLSCASGWWTWMPGGSTATAAATSGLERLDDDEPGIEDLPQLTVSGTARLEKPADEARLSVGVTTEAPEARTALARNSERMDAVITALRAAGLDEDEYSTGRFRIRPEYDRRPRNAPEDWKPRIVGYTVSNALDVATSRLELVGELIAAANDAGANEVSITGFALSKPERFRPEVVRDATAIAIADARTLAEAAGLELVRILRIDASPAARPLIARDAPMAMARMAADAAPPVEAGDVTLSATVRIVYEVRAAGG
jgi:uncharacterized protein YggE